MPNGTLTMADVVDALKLFYLPGLRYQLNDQVSAFLTQIERDTENVVGEKVVMALRYGRQGGTAMLANDNSDLGTPNSRKSKQVSWETKNFSHRFRITEKTIKASESKAGAFASMLETEISDSETDAKLSIARQVIGDGSGKLCTITAASHASGVLTLTVDNVAYLGEGMLVDIYDVSGAAVLTNGATLEMTAVDDTNNTAKLSCATDISANIQTGTDYLTVQKSAGNELTGLGLLFNNSASLYGVSRSDYPVLKPYVNAVDGEISENAIQTAIDKVENRSGSKVNFIQCSLGVRRGYINYLSARKQTPNTLDLKGGWEAISYSAGGKPIPIVGDKYVPSGIMDLLDMNDWKLYHMGDFDWMDRDGAMLKQVIGKPAYEATLLRFMDLGCQRARGQARMSGIIEH